MACIDLDQIFSIQLVNDETGGEGENDPNKTNENSATMKIIYYDKHKFETEMSKKKDPFDAASKYMKYKFRKINQKVREEFEQRISLEKQNNFASFF